MKVYKVKIIAGIIKKERVNDLMDLQINDKNIKTKNSEIKEKICRVVLLNPPTAAESSEILLNLAYLSATLKKAGHDVLVIDSNAPYRRLNESEIEKKILEFKPHFIGVTLTITYIVQTYDYFKRLRKLSIPIVAGGPHANCLPEEVLNHGADIVAIGEGEETINEIAAYFLGRKKLQEIKGICFRKNDGTPSYTAMRPLIQDLDGISFADFSAFPSSYYTGTDDPNTSKIFWAIFSSRGCPFNCIFCSSHNVFGRTFRARSAENVFQEVEDLAEKYGARYFAFQDDEAFISKDRIIKFCDLAIKSPFKLNFSARLRIDSLDEKMLIMMKNAGFSRLAFGLESFDDESLLKMNKHYNVETVFKAFETLEKAKFKYIHFNQLVGFPWETPEHLKNGLEKISKISRFIVYFCCVATLIPFPKTKLYDDYHAQYGFTEWWLDPKRNSKVKSTASDAFFMMFLSMYGPLYCDDIFWNHSKEMKKAINNFCLKVSSMQLRRCLNFCEFQFAYNLSKISHFVWKRSPKIENVLFYVPKKIAKFLKLDKKASFINY